MSKKKTSAEIFNEDAAEMEAQEKALLEGAVPKTPLEAAIDRATGFTPEDAVIDAKETEKAETETEKAETETEKPETETEKPETETEKPETETEKPETGTKNRDWVEEAYECFIKDAQGIDPTNPVKAVEAYFQKNATDELKARCRAEGKDAKGCWKFIEAVARKALHGSSGHIDPAVVYAIAMHWFQDVPADWNMPKVLGTAAAPKKPTTRKERLEERVAHGSSKAKAELRELKKKERAKAAKAKAAKAKKPKQQQGFFFEMLEMQPDEQKPCGSSSPQASAGASGEETAMEPSSLPASTSSESEVKGS